MTEFDWSAYLDVAERLYAEDADEATLRTCISRAYYATFHAARRHVRQHVDVPRPHAHRFVWRWYTAHSSSNLRNLGHLGLRLSQLRNGADYDGTIHPSPREVREVLDRAAGFLTTLASLSQ